MQPAHHHSLPTVQDLPLRVHAMQQTQVVVSWGIRQYLCLITMIFTGLTACRTVQSTAESGASTVQAASITNSLRLDKNDEQHLYLTMLQVELNAGVKVPKDQMRSAAGLVACSKASGLSSCNLRVRLGKTELSATQPITRGVSEQILAFIQQARPELDVATLYFVDALCNYIGKASPPYKIEYVQCQINSPRNVNESIFDDASAEELADLLRGDTSFGDAIVTINGTIACQAIAQSARRLCVVRSIENGVLAEKIREVSSQHAHRIATALFQSLTDLNKLEKRSTPSPPTEIVASLMCIIDSTQQASSGRRFYKCRAAL